MGGETREKEANVLLSQTPRDPEYPAYSEREMARKRWRHYITLDPAWMASWVDARPPQGLTDEIWFLAALSDLTHKERLCLRLWLDGWTRQEIFQVFGRTLEARAQKNIYYTVRKALLKCYDTRTVSFSAFSHHTLYRRPARSQGVR